MKFATILIAGASLFAVAAPATAMTFDWSFDDSFQGEPDLIVTGTISGLTEGANDASGLTVTVTSTPTGEGVGLFSYDGAGGSFTVTDGEITDALAGFTIGDGIGLFFNTHPGGFGQSYPGYVKYNDPDGDATLAFQFTSSNPTLFERVADGVPEPASWALMVGGFGLTGAAMRRRKIAVRFA